MKTGLATLALVFIFSSCRKEESQLLPDRVLKMPSEVRLNSVVCNSNNQWFIVGGKQLEVGYVFRSSDAGSSWDVFKTDEVSNLYAIQFKDSLHGMAGGDQCFYWTTSDGGDSWQYQWLADQVPFNGEDRPAIRDIQFVGDSTILFCAGQSYNKGVFYRSRDNGRRWQFDFFSHELRTILSAGQEAYVAGYGLGLKVNDGYQYFQTIDNKGSYIVSSVNDNGNYFEVDFEGRILKSNSDFDAWQEVFSARKMFVKHQTLNAIASNGNALVVVGNDGRVLISDNNGQNWKTFVLENSPNLFDVAWTGKSWLAISDEGLAYEFNSTQ